MAVYMFQNNPLLSQLKQQIRDSKPHVEGIVRRSDKSFGFLETDKKVISSHRKP